MDDDRRLDPLRQSRLLLGKVRQAVLDQCDSLIAELDDVDNQLAALATRRRALVVKLKERRALLSPRLAGVHGRRPAPDGSVRLPPLDPNCTRLWGRRLRNACVTLLQRAGALALPELHVLLHHHGYAIASDHPVKALSDALSYEVERGRLRREARGVYGPVGPPDRARRGFDHPTPPCHRLDHLSTVLAPHAAA